MHQEEKQIFETKNLKLEKKVNLEDLKKNNLLFIKQLMLYQWHLLFLLKRKTNITRNKKFKSHIRKEKLEEILKIYTLDNFSFLILQLQ